MQIEFINNIMNHKDRSLKQYMLNLDEMFMVEESEHVSRRLMEKISSLEFSFVLVYRKKRECILGYLKIKDVVLKYIKSNDQTKAATIASLVKNRYFSAVPVYHDAVAVEALEIF